MRPIRLPLLDRVLGNTNKINELRNRHVILPPRQKSFHFLEKAFFLHKTEISISFWINLKDSEKRKKLPQRALSFLNILNSVKTQSSQSFADLGFVNTTPISVNSANPDSYRDCDLCGKKYLGSI